MEDAKKSSRLKSSKSNLLDFCRSRTLHAPHISKFLGWRCQLEYPRARHHHLRPHKIDEASDHGGTFYTIWTKSEVETPEPVLKKKAMNKATASYRDPSSLLPQRPLGVGHHIDSLGWTWLKRPGPTAILPRCGGPSPSWDGGSPASPHPCHGRYRAICRGQVAILLLY